MKLSELQRYCLNQMKITAWEKFSPEAISGAIRYQVYYEESSEHSGQDKILLNNIVKALGWDNRFVKLQAINKSFKLVDQGMGVILWFGFESAARLGLIQKECIQQVNNLYFFPNPKSISTCINSKRAVWQVLKQMKI